MEIDEKYGHGEEEGPRPFSLGWEISYFGNNSQDDKEIKGKNTNKKRFLILE